MKYSDEFETEEEKKSSGKGFYIALAICLIAICGIAVTTFVSTLPKDEPESGDQTTVSTTTTTRSVQQVVIPATDVKDDRTTTTAATATTTAKPTEAADLFVFPVSNRVLRPFSKTHYFSDTLGEWVTHNGVDFAAEAGDKVKAAADGTIKSIRQDALWGDVIEMEHDGNVITRYCGVTAASIAEGQSVKAGEEIGAVSSVPAEVLDPTHLHMEVMVNGTYTDPLTLIQGQTVVVTTAATTTTTTK
ncbi:MAG: M23 family metallopeptidase [Clostridia bacterium]|nr:M23 family metallopeptidase [Clostridia bacterium]